MTTNPEIKTAFDKALAEIAERVRKNPETFSEKHLFVAFSEIPDQIRQMLDLKEILNQIYEGVWTITIMVIRGQQGALFVKN